MESLSSKVQSSALGYSITFVLFVGLMTSGLVLVSGVNRRIETIFLGNDKMLVHNQVSANYFADQDDLESETLIHSSGDTTQLTQKKWAGYKLVTATTVRKNKKIKRAFIYGSVFEEKISTLYLAERNQKLSIGGTTKIEGWIKAPKRGIQRANISGKPFKGNKLFKGKLEISEKHLPKIKSELLKLKANNYFDLPVLEKLPFDSSFSFEEKTQLYTSKSKIELNGFLRGNLIVHSLERVIIHSQADLDKILIIAPVVEIRDNFKGRINVIAHQRIDCLKNVQLKYPSTLILNEITKNLSDSPNGIYIGENSSVIGGVALISSDPNFRKPLFLNLNGSLVAGLIYNVGETQLKGQVYGSVMTSKFILKTGGGVYGSHLVDAIISNKIPKNFAYPDWLKEITNTRTELIECL